MERASSVPSDLSAPDYTTLSRRSQHLRRRLRPVPPGEGLHLVLDSTGLSIVGAGEWVLAPFAVDQAADLCSCGHENDDSAAGLVYMSWTATGTRTTATWNA